MMMMDEDKLWKGGEILGIFLFLISHLRYFLDSDYKFVNLVWKSLHIYLLGLL